ncbi:STM4015 family protein [Dactylosporangium sp. AC04546]|uniref:STM4015 family protein n=1 Tax=Dactylosporangium sp. AC04546 TaxID=2862460 RepID=UPI001EDE87C9|nr:STM4015 family protein [Dactylosporangium sp. AC04546]WVK81771.1 STM4015 family protein [Dactylosporangium sp. AC04546]
MTISQHITSFAGLPVTEFQPGVVDRLDAAGTPRGAVAWRIETDYEDSVEVFTSTLDRLLDVVGGEHVHALVIGQWGSAYDTAPPLDRLIAVRDRMPNLKALFVGEMTYEECEISWIHHGEIAPLLGAFPGLEVLWIRGADGLRLAPVRHRRLKELGIESGGLSAAVVRGIADSSFPALTNLELWLGVREYGGDVGIDHLTPILGGAELPALRRLALRNAEIADLVAEALAAAPVVARLEELDLSLGILSDRGAEALLLGQPLTHLRRLGLSHHFISADLGERLAAELPGVEVDLSDEQEADDPTDRYVSVAE